MNKPTLVKRRHFVSAAVAAGLASGFPNIAVPATCCKLEDNCEDGITVPNTLDGMSLKALRDDYQQRLFEQYLPFWEKGAFDSQRGGFTCELNDDGSVAEDEKSLTYQGRGLWVYAFLYNHFGSDPHWLRMATATRDFMVKSMYAKGGKWLEKVRRDGTVLEGPSKIVFGPLFAAAGLAQYYAAVRDPRDLALVKQTLEMAEKAYDDPAYTDPLTTKYTAVEVPSLYLRTQGHSMVFVWALSELLNADQDQYFADLQRKHVDLLCNRFWNDAYGISNEYLKHDYSRTSATGQHMYAGHALESQWILMLEAVRTKDRRLFDLVAHRSRRLLEMCWDYVFDGFANGDFFVFDTEKQCRGPDYDIKTMWAQCETMGACLTVLEYTGDVWAKEWYDRVRTFAIRTMPVADHGVWRQAVDRLGKDLIRVGISTKRKDNFHQVRMLMHNLLSLDRVIKNNCALTPFPQ